MKCMKKIMLLLLAAGILAACEKDPDIDELDNKYLVYTNYDTGTDFNAFQTFYLPDSILLMTSSLAPDYWKDETALAIIKAYADNMEALGYTRTDNRDNADIGLQVSYVQSRYQVTSVNYPTWWWGYPNYWDIAYWGNWGFWYYPYAVSYGISTGSFLAEMLNLKAPQGEDEELPVVWSCYMTGLLSQSQSYDRQRVVEAVDQAYTQSPYLNRQ